MSVNHTVFHQFRRVVDHNDRARLREQLQDIHQGLAIAQGDATADMVEIQQAIVASESLTRELKRVQKECRQSLKRGC